MAERENDISRSRARVPGDNFRMSSGDSAVLPLRYLLQRRDCALRSLSSLLVDACVMRRTQFRPTNVLMREISNNHFLFEISEYTARVRKKYANIISDKTKE